MSKELTIFSYPELFNDPEAERVKRRKQLVYIAGPYRGATPVDIYGNIMLARQFAMAWWKRGYSVICPHSNTAFFDGIVPDGWFLDGDIEILKRCNIIAMLPNWRSSQGAVAELKVAEQNDIVIYFH